MKKEKEIISGKLECKSGKFGFFIPNERAFYGGDFFVATKNFNWAKDWDRVRAEVIAWKGKKPEVQIIEVVTGNHSGKIKLAKKKEKKEVLKTVEGIYSGWDGNFWFIDVPGQEKWFFVYGKKKNWAQDGDLVKADIIKFKDKDEAIVVEILDQEEEVLDGVYTDNDRFGFVLPDDRSNDIFIAGSRKWEAEHRDRVRVKIIKRWGKNPEWIILEVL